MTRVYISVLVDLTVIVSSVEGVGVEVDVGAGDEVEV
jgi:hypothetical protein